MKTIFVSAREIQVFLSGDQTHGGKSERKPFDRVRSKTSVKATAVVSRNTQDIRKKQLDVLLRLFRMGLNYSKRE